MKLPVWQKEAYESDVEAQRMGSILIAENEDMVPNFLVGVLEKHHRVETVESGAKALELFDAGKYDVAMVDLGMPEMPGDRVAEVLRQQDPNVATVLITGWDLESNDARRSVFDFYIKKPFDSVNKILNILAHAIRPCDARSESQT